ncbi:MAG: ATP-binding protein [Acidobacteriota bacterium]|nr:ATP-binding protein [Acidobacteriota bacterium]
MTARIFLKLIAVIACLIAVALVAADLLASRVAERYLVHHLRQELEDKGRLLAVSGAVRVNGVSTPIAELAKSAGARLTIVTTGGRVVADSEADASTMENHSGRPELQRAFKGGVGSATRMSRTLHLDFLYVAVPLQGGAIRLAMPLSVLNTEVTAIRIKILQSVAIAFLPSVLLAAFLARRLAGRLSSIINYAGELANANFEARLSNDGRGELGLLSRKLNETSAKLQGTVRQLQLEHTQLDRLERIRKDFVINVSHELRTPLASIQGYTETLLEGAINDSDNNIRFLNIIRHNAERLTRLTADLLTLSRLELRTQDFRFASFHVNDLLADVVDTIRPIAQKKDISLRHEPGPGQCEIFCDSEAFYQVVSNLLDNAVKYTPAGGYIAVGSKPVQRPDGTEWVEFFIRDTGMGIPAEEQSRLFERFYRVDKARSRELGGTGLGLAIVKHLVRAHGGEVRVESLPGYGSTFFFTMPVELTDIGAIEMDAADVTALNGR